MKRFSRTCSYVEVKLGQIKFENGDYKVEVVDTQLFEDLKQAHKYANKNNLQIVYYEERCELRSIDMLEYIRLSKYEKDVFEDLDGE